MAGKCVPLTECPVGQESCACTQGGACDGELICVDNECVVDPCPCDANVECDWGCSCDPACGGLKRVFVTSQRWTANLKQAGGGARAVEGADALCNQAAAKLGGNWKAWLSEDFPSNDPVDRLSSDGPWHLVGTGEVVFQSKQDLAVSTRAPLVAIDRDEHGAQLSVSTVGDMAVWTGTAQVPGSFVGTDCSAFSYDAAPPSPSQHGMIGEAIRVDKQWTESGIYDCSNPARLYCFEE
jgi:hypothetical protein